MSFSDETRRRLDADADQIIARYPHSRSALLPLLHLVQAEEGHVSDDGIDYCAERLGLAESEVASVVSFYTMFKRHPVGEYHVGVCTNTLCAIMGGDQILADLREHLGVADHEATPDGKVSLEHVECNAACDYAPVVMANWEFFDKMTPDSARDLVDGLRSGAQITLPRGPDHLGTWRGASRVLACVRGGAGGLRVQGGAARRQSDAPYRPFLPGARRSRAQGVLQALQPRQAIDRSRPEAGGRS